MSDRKYNIAIRVIQQGGVIPSNCNAITFINTSLIDTVKINTFPIQPGQSLTIEGNENELDITNYICELGTGDPGTFYVLTKIFNT